jgi:hypothetical protein
LLLLDLLAGLLAGLLEGLISGFLEGLIAGFLSGPVMATTFYNFPLNFDLSKYKYILIARKRLNLLCMRIKIEDYVDWVQLYARRSPNEIHGIIFIGNDYRYLNMFPGPLPIEMGDGVHLDVERRHIILFCALYRQCEWMRHHECVNLPPEDKSAFESFMAMMHDSTEDIAFGSSLFEAQVMKTIHSDEDIFVYGTQDTFGFLASEYKISIKKEGTVI